MFINVQLMEINVKKINEREAQKTKFYSSLKLARVQ